MSQVEQIARGLTKEDAVWMRDGPLSAIGFERGMRLVDAGLLKKVDVFTATSGGYRFMRTPLGLRVRQWLQENDDA